MHSIVAFAPSKSTTHPTLFALPSAGTNNVQKASANNVRYGAPGSLPHDPGAPGRCTFCQKHVGPLDLYLTLLSGFAAVQIASHILRF